MVLRPTKQTVGTIPATGFGLHPFGGFLAEGMFGHKTTDKKKTSVCKPSKRRKPSSGEKTKKNRLLSLFKKIEIVSFFLQISNVFLMGASSVLIAFIFNASECFKTACFY